VIRRLPLIVLLVLLPLRAFAYRPFDSTDADVAQLGNFEIELGPAGYLGVGRQEYVTLPSLVLNYGFAPGWEVVFSGVYELSLGPGLTPAQRSAVTQTGLTLKHVLRPGVLQDGTGLSIATEFGLLLPGYSGNPGVTDISQGTGLWLAGICSWRWGDATLHLNLALEVTAQALPGTEDALIIEGPERWPVRPVAELLGEYVAGRQYQATALIGAIWRISEQISLDAALRGGASDHGFIREVRAGLTWTIPVGPRETGRE
jgi:hypothetical protein